MSTQHANIIENQYKYSNYNLINITKSPLLKYESHKIVLTDKILILYIEKKIIEQLAAIAKLVCHYNTQLYI